LSTLGPSVIDTAGNVYSVETVLGQWPVTSGAAQPQPGGGVCGLHQNLPCSDAYISKIGPKGSLLIGTMLGGPTSDSAGALAVDAAGNIYVSGQTGGSFPVTANAAIPANATTPMYAAKLSADGSTFLYATYLPASVSYLSTAMTVDADGNLYIGGNTNDHHAMVIKLSADGSAFLYNTVLASKGTVSALAVDPSGNVVAAGSTEANDLPVTQNALQATLPGVYNAFVVKLDPAGNILFATYLGGSGQDRVSAVQADSAGNIYVAGTTTSPDFPTTANGFQPTQPVPLWSGGNVGFIAKMAPGASSMAYSTYVTGVDGVTAMAVSRAGEAYLTGITLSGFPVTESAPRPCLGLGLDTYVAHLSASGGLLDATYVSLPNGRPSALSVASDGSVFVEVLSEAPNPLVLAQIRFGGGGWNAPACMTQDVLNAASQEPASGVVPGELVTLVGFGIGPESGVAYQPGPQGQIPTSLAGVEVFFDGQPAPVLYAQSRQVNAVAPFGIALTTEITLQYNNTTFGPFSKPVALADPEIFRLLPGVSTQAAAINQDNTINGPSNPAPRGSVVSLFGTGFGPTNPGCTAGGLNVPAAANLAEVTVTVNDGAAPVIYAGSAPTLPCGVTQINMLVPAVAAPGPYSLLLTSGSAQNNGGRSTIIVK